MRSLKETGYIEKQTNKNRERERESEFWNIPILTNRKDERGPAKETIIEGWRCQRKPRTVVWGQRKPTDKEVFKECLLTHQVDC